VKYFQKLLSFFALVIVLSSSGLGADELIHVVARGETVYSISRQYRVDVNELMRANNISDPSTLQAGRRLMIPSAAAPQTASSTIAVPATSTQTLVDYRVQRGDTLFNIARSSGITLANLLEINGFSTNHVIRAGDVIKVPGRSAPAVQTTTPATPAAIDGVYALRWPITPKDITYMTGRMGVVVEGEYFESVRSLTVGNVISAGPWRKFGRVVIVEAAGGYFYMYGGCESLSVNVGDRITPGTEVGKLGINAVSERAQLFFMVFRSDTPIDPALAPRANDNAKT